MPARLQRRTPRAAPAPRPQHAPRRAAPPPGRAARYPGRNRHAARPHANGRSTVTSYAAPTRAPGRSARAGAVMQARNNSVLPAPTSRTQLLPSTK